MFQDGSTLSAKLTTTGRVTGQAHTVRLRLVYYQERFFASRRDGRSDWCRNLLANPEVSVELEGRHFGGRAVLVADEDLRQKISELKYGNQRSLEPRGVINLLSKSGAEGQIRDPTSPSVVSYLVAYPLVFRTPFRLCL